MPRSARRTWGSRLASGPDGENHRLAALGPAFTGPIARAVIFRTCQARAGQPHRDGLAPLAPTDLVAFTNGEHGGSQGLGLNSAAAAKAPPSSQNGRPDYQGMAPGEGRLHPCVIAWVHEYDRSISDVYLHFSSPRRSNPIMMSESLRGFMRSLSIAVSLLPMALATSVFAQTITEAQMRASNLARMQAEMINGGGGKYSPEDCMHQGGGANCLQSNTPQGFRIRFLGGPAGWAARREPASIETVVFVSPDGNLSKVEYNGPVR